MGYLGTLEKFECFGSIARRPAGSGQSGDWQTVIWALLSHAGGLSLASLHHALPLGSAETLFSSACFLFDDSPPQSSPSAPPLEASSQFTQRLRLPPRLCLLDRAFSDDSLIAGLFITMTHPPPKLLQEELGLEANSPGMQNNLRL